MFNLEDMEPFYKKLSEIEYADIQNLIDNQVSEGWYIEYKEALPKNYNIAKSISSFANSDGGWYIVGIKEKSGKSYADEIIGLNSDEILGLKEQIASIIKDRIHPTPIFESKIVNCGQDKNVLIVYIDKGKDAPYITGGSIYQRVGEVSDPNPLSDRYLLEKLMDRKKEFKLKIDNFCRNEFVTLQDFTQPFLEFYVYFDENICFKNFFTSEFMDELKENFNNEIGIISDELNITANISFSNMYSSVDSYILRNTDENVINNIGCAIELFVNGNFKFILPFNLFKEEEINPKFHQFYDSTLKICNLPLSIIIFEVVVNQYIRLLNKHEFEGNMYVRFNLKNCFQSALFFNDDLFEEYVIENGVPINFKSEISVKYGEMSIIFDFENFNCKKFIADISKSFGVSDKLLKSFSAQLAKIITQNK